jgi:hypothetical protein
MRKIKGKPASKPRAASKRTSKRVSKPAARLQPLETGQVWRVGEQNLQIVLMGKLLVHYKLAVPNAVRVSNSVGGRGAVEKYLKTNKGVLLKTVKADAPKF